MITNYLKLIGTKRKQSQSDKSDESIPKKNKKWNVLVGFDNKREKNWKYEKPSTCHNLAWVYQNKSHSYTLSEGLELWWLKFQRGISNLVLDVKSTWAIVFK